MNPDPVTLKMEKVYHPCFLLTKKRYVGYSYESPDQVDPIFDAKGIETVRRDTCDAVAKAMEQTLRLYFEHQDISKVTVCPCMHFPMLWILKSGWTDSIFNFFLKLFGSVILLSVIRSTLHPEICMSQIFSFLSLGHIVQI